LRPLRGGGHGSNVFAPSLLWRRIHFGLWRACDDLSVPKAPSTQGIRSSAWAALMQNADATLTEILGTLTRASEEQTMPVDARRGASQSDELQAAHTGSLFFFASAVPLIWINGPASEEQSVPVTPLMRCHEVFIDLRPPMLSRWPHFLTSGLCDLATRRRCGSPPRPSPRRCQMRYWLGVHCQRM
jgi:hypothetical protein